MERFVCYSLSCNMGDSSKSIRRIQTPASPFSWADSISVGAGVIESTQTSPGSYSEVVPQPAITPRCIRSEIPALTKDDSSSAKILRKIDTFDKTYIPKKGFCVATKASLAEAQEVFGLWRELSRKWEEATNASGTNLVEVHQSICAELSKKLGISESGPDELLDSVVDYFAERGVLFPLPIRIIIMPTQGKEELYFLGPRLDNDFLWVINKIENRQIKLLDGRTRDINVTHVAQVPKCDEERVGFVRHGIVCIVQGEQEDAWNVWKSKYDNKRSEFKVSANAMQALDKVKAKKRLTDTSRELLVALDFSNFMFMQRTRVNLEDSLSSLVHHEGEHIDDFSNPQTMALFAKIDDNVLRTTVEEFRARVNELNGGTLGAKLFSMSDLLLTRHVLKEGTPSRKDLRLGSILSEYLFLKLIVQEIKKDPLSFEIVVRKAAYDENIQICGQLYKTVKRRDASKRFLEVLKPYADDPELLLKQIDEHDPFYSVVKFQL